MKRLADWVGGAVSGVVTYRLWKKWREPEPVPATAPAGEEPDERAGGRVNLLAADRERRAARGDVEELGRAALRLVVLGDDGLARVPAVRVQPERLDPQAMPDRDPVRVLLRGELVKVCLLVC